MQNTNPIKIAFLTADNARSRHVYSGIYYYMGEALMRNGFEVTFIGPLKQWEEQVKTRRDTVQKAVRPVFKIRTEYLLTYFVSKRYARRAEKILKNKEFDFIFAPNARREIAFLKTNIPIIYANDGLWGLLINYLRNFKELNTIAVNQGHFIEKSAINNSSLMSFPTKWAADYAIDWYGANASKVSVIPWGANLENVPPREIVLKKELSGECKLLFVGKGWERKGGEIAFETLLELEKTGVNAHLTICGCTPPGNISHPRLTVIQNLDKNNEQQRNRLSELFLTSDFFILPTRADCYGIVFSEAAAFGLPVIATNTGGVSGVVKEGINGHLLPLEARGDQYAKLIKEIYLDKVRYDKLVHSSRDRFENYLNWDVWAKSLGEQLHAYKASHPKADYAKLSQA